MLHLLLCLTLCMDVTEHLSIRCLFQSWTCGDKRRRHHAGAAEMEEEEEEEEALGEPGFRALAGVRLRHKPNCVTVAAEAAGSGRAVVCVATTGDAIEVLSV